MSEYRQVPVKPTQEWFDKVGNSIGLCDMEIRDMHAAFIAAAPKSDDSPVYLPKITPEIEAHFAGECFLIDHDPLSKKRVWSQEAVDFAGLLNRQRMPKPDDELARLERELATEIALCSIECEGLPMRGGTEPCDPPWLDLATAEFSDDVTRYLELRGLLEHNLDNPNLVRIKEVKGE